MRAIPYLTFDGNAEEAVNLYRSVLGGELSIMRFGEMPPDETMPISAAWTDKIMHAELAFGDDQTLYVSDIFEGGTVQRGDNVAVHIDVDTEEDLGRFFNGLSEGATITMPVERQFWGAVYGSLVDRFGISWGFHYDLPQ